MKIRTGRRNGRNLYLQIGESPADNDPCLGFIIDPDVAAEIVSLFDSCQCSPDNPVNMIHSTLAGLD